MPSEHPIDRLAKRLASRTADRGGRAQSAARALAAPINGISRRHMLAGAVTTAAAVIFAPLRPSHAVARSQAGARADGAQQSCDCAAARDVTWNQCYQGVLPKSYPGNGVAAGLLVLAATHEAQVLCTPQADNARAGCTQVPCSAGETCITSVSATSRPYCKRECPDGQTKCKAGCADLQNDPKNCGFCGHVCVGPSHCADGHCTVCAGPFPTLCGKRCVNTSTDLFNCGSCGHACGDRQMCTGGQCVCMLEGMTNCGTYCVYDGISCDGPGSL